jgi:predicted RND superfamily exporter protein
MIGTLLKYKYFCLVVLSILVVVALFKVPFLQVDTDISQFFNEEDTDYSFYQKMKSEFSSQENMILFGVKSQGSIFEPIFLKQIAVLTDSLKNTPNIKKVKSLLNLSYPVKSAFGIVGIPYVNRKSNGELTYQKNKILNDELPKSFINREGNALFLWIETEQNLDVKNLDILIEAINLLRTEATELTTFLWGRKVIDVSFKNILIKEILTFGFWIFIFLCLSLAFIFKRPAALFFPILLVLVVIVLFLGGLVSLGRPISTLSNLFPTIILIVAVSDVIHLCIKYDLESKKGLSSKQATKNALKEIGFTTLITSFTTAIGFLVLYLSPMQAIRNFGVESAILVVLTFLLTLIFLPLFFSGIKRGNLFTISKPFNALSEIIFKQLDKLYKYQNTVIIVFTVLLLISSYGVTLISTNSTLYSIPKKTDLYNSYKFFESNFGGSRTFELVIYSKKEQKLNEPELLKTVYSIENYLTHHPNLNFVKSPVDYYRIMSQAYLPSTYKNTPLPLEINTITKYEKQLATFLTKDYFANKDRSIFKFNAQMQDVGKHNIETIQKDILENIKILIDKKPIGARLSGIDMLIDISQKKSTESTFIGLLIAIILVSITLGFLYKSVALGILAVFLNLIPLLMTAGIMGYFNVDLRAEIALIFTVGFVIAVDDTIHLLSKFQWERKKGVSIESAIKIAVLECGKAILATSIILVGGFFILMGSGSLEIFTLGLLVGLIVIITLGVDLILAPIIILKWFKKPL